MGLVIPASGRRGIRALFAAAMAGCVLAGVNLAYAADGAGSGEASYLPAEKDIFPLPWNTVSFSGPLTISCSPMGAPLWGAKWRLFKIGSSDWSSWQTFTNTAQELAPGLYRFQFAPPTGYKKPPEQSVLVVANESATLHAQYKPVDTYELTSYSGAADVYQGRGIPDVRVREGETVSFFVRCSQLPGAAWSMTVTPQDGSPVATPTTTPWGSGLLFSYTPGSEDRAPFKIEFKASAGSATVSQTIEVTPLADLPPEHSLVAGPRDLPDPESSDYLVVSNEYVMGPRFVHVSGKRVVIGKGFAKNKLFEILDDPDATKQYRSVIIYADYLQIRNALHLPGANVKIYARTLDFEDQGGSEAPAALITTATGYTVRAAEGKDGQDGKSGGDIALNIETFVETTPTAKRLVMDGGLGQDPGLGKNGDPGEALPSDSTGQVKYWLDWSGTWASDSDYYSAHITRFYWKHATGFLLGFVFPFQDSQGNGLYYDTDEWLAMPWQPENGHDATPGGAPGNGGNGGTLSCPLGLTSWAESTGGNPGIRAPYYFGGEPKGPVPAIWMEFGDYVMYPQPEWQVTHYESYVASSGKDAPSPAPSKGAGNPGSVKVAGDPLSWLHPGVLRPVLQYAKDAYLYGQVDYARDTYEEYLKLIDEWEQHGLAAGLSSQETQDLEVMRQEMTTLLHRATSQLDYFGNPPDWVPMLSLGISWAAFDNEVKTSIPLLYVIHRLNDSNVSINDKIQTLQDSRSKVESEIASSVQQYDDLQKLIPALDTQSTSIAQDIETAKLRLASLQATLLWNAEVEVEKRHKAPWYKETFQVLGACCCAVGVFVPAVGVAGLALEVAANFDPNNPSASIAGGKNVYAAYKSSGFSLGAAEVDKKLEGLDTKNPGKCVQDLMDVAKQMSAKVSAIKDLFKDTVVPKSEVEALFKDIAAHDPAFVQMTQDLLTLNNQKELFAKQLSEAIQKASKLSNNIMQDLEHLQNTDETLGAAYHSLNYPLESSLKMMETRLRDRLLLYQYYMAKSYEYQTLQPYTGGYNLDRVSDAYADLMQTGTPTETEVINAMSAAYTDELHSIAQSILTFSQENYGDLKTKGWVDLSPDECTQLSRTGKVTINLMEKGAFPLLEENVRIADLHVKPETTQISVKGGAPAGTVSVKLDFRHTGDSYLYLGGSNYRFDHYRDPSTDSAIRWTASYNVQTHEWAYGEVDPGNLDLIAQLLQLPTVPTQLYARPAAWANLEIVKSTTGLGEGQKVSVDSMTLEVDYVSGTVDSSQYRKLIVSTDDGLNPKILVDPLDDGNDEKRGDGFGYFIRSYHDGTVATLRPPKTFGTWQFDAWYESHADGPPVKHTSLPIKVTMDQAKRIRLSYTNTEAYDGRIFGDFNSDHAVDEDDFAILMQHWPQPDASGFSDVAGASYGPGDYWNLMNYWGKVVP